MKKIFSFWGIVVSIAWAKSLTWTVTTEKEQRTLLVALNIIERDRRLGNKINYSKAVEFVLGPLAIVIGSVW